MDGSGAIRLRAKQAGEYLRVSRSTLSKWRMRGCGPTFHRCGPRIVYYYKHEIDAWLDECDRAVATRHTPH
jgi:predicted DNA-binding transcriptional regulator AlpA